MKTLFLILSIFFAHQAMACSFDEAVINTWKSTGNIMGYFDSEYSALKAETVDAFDIELGICTQEVTYDMACIYQIKPHRFIVDKKTCMPHQAGNQNLPTLRTQKVTALYSSNSGISNNHQVNPAHRFKALVCVEKQSRGVFGLMAVITVPDQADGQAKVYFKRFGDQQRSLVSAWTIKYILSPGSYATFANQFQGMNISKGPGDDFQLTIQLHDNNGKNGIYAARLSVPSLLGYGVTVRDNHEKEMICKFK